MNETFQLHLNILFMYTWIFAVMTSDTYPLDGTCVY